MNKMTSIYSSLLKQNQDTLYITDTNKIQVIDQLTQIFHNFTVKNSLNYLRTYESLKFLINGIFRRDLINELFQNMSKDWNTLQFLTKYIKDVADVFSEDQEDNEQQCSSCLDVQVSHQDSDRWCKNCEIQSRYSNSVRNLEDQLSVCSEQIYAKQRLSPYQYTELPNIKSFQVIQPIKLTIFPPQLSIPKTYKPINNSDLSTNSSHHSFLSKSCMITEKSKQFILKGEQINTQKMDYKKQYQKKLHNALVKNAMTLYKKRK